MTDDTPAAVADKPRISEAPGVMPEIPHRPPPAPAPGRLARFRAAGRKRLGTSLFFVYLGVFSIAGTALLTDGDQLNLVGVAGFTLSMLARYARPDRNSRGWRLIKCYGDIAAVVLMASIVRDTFAAHPFMKGIAYLVVLVFCGLAARVFDREVFGTPESDKTEKP